MNALVFVDTNVLVYARDAAQPHKQRVASELLTQLWREQTGRTSTQVLNEYYVTVTRKLKPGIPIDDAWDDVQALMAWEPQSIDRELLTVAREVERRYLIGWWDSMMVAAAQLQNCALLVSEDLQNGMTFGRVVVRNPFVSKVEDAKIEYVGPTASIARHRPRGRPTKVQARA